MRFISRSKPARCKRRQLAGCARYTLLGVEVDVRAMGEGG
jgi:hypothetical protein